MIKVYLEQQKGNVLLYVKEPDINEMQHQNCDQGEG
jgi:hypothetical protein